MHAASILALFAVGLILIVDVLLYCIYCYRYAAKHGYANYYTGSGFYFFYKVEFDEEG